MNDEQYDLTYISLGAGVQSSLLLVLSALGLKNVPKADLAIFADTQDEPLYVYEHLWRLAEWSHAHGIPVHMVSAGQLSGHGDSKSETGRLSLPFFSESGAMTHRQCTSQYKIRPIEKYVREYIGYKKGQRVRHRCRCMLGITVDEIQRMKPSRTPWITSAFPLIEANMHRQTCLDMWDKLTDMPRPKRSACVFCPFHSNADWRHLRDEVPEAWARAVAFDKSIRNVMQDRRPERVFLHKQCKPLDECEIDDDGRQIDMFLGECEGMCGV